MTIWAHPDDESYLAGSLMAAVAALGARVTCVTATLGERGGPADQQAETAWRRAEELSEGLRVLGVAEHVVFGLPDGGCSMADPAHPVRAIVELLATRQPETIVTFGARRPHRTPRPPGRVEVDERGRDAAPGSSAPAAPRHRDA
ncbi:MAG: PIG-L deacetylase family protein [Acidimicrobiia bacterium]